MAKQWRNAVVGVGVVGSWHVQVIPRLGDCTLVAVCDKDPEKARTALKNYGMENVPVYTDQAEMLAKEEIDIVHICTPSGDHMGPAIMAMEAGKNVICEKPMEIQLDRIDRMIESAAKNNVRLAGIFQTRWNDSNRALKQAMEEGRFGTLSYAGCFTPWYRTDQYYRDGGWRGTWRLDGGGAIMNQSVHAVDLLQWIAGPIKTVSAHASSRIHPEIEVEDTLTCAVTFENGAHGVIMGSTGMYPGIAVRIELGGSNGTAVQEGTLKIYKFRDEKTEDAELIQRLNAPAGTTMGGSSNTDVLLDQHIKNIRSILDAWEEGRDAETSGPEARKAVAIIRAMYDSAKQGGAPVNVS
jgi:predicted dehydrogenase